MSRLSHPSLPPKPSVMHAPPPRPSSAAATSSSASRVMTKPPQPPTITTAVGMGQTRAKIDFNILDDEKMATPFMAQSSPQGSTTENKDPPTPELSLSQTTSTSSGSQPSTSQRTHSLPLKPLTSSKRKLEVTDFPYNHDEAVSKPRLNSASSQPESGPAIAKPKETSEIEAVKPKVIPILPTPLPSKRFKKGQTKSLLIPIEQLPVFALPPLPVITDPILETTVFQHQSMFPKTRARFEDTALHYEKLEHVGDSILGMIVTTWLQETKPNLTCGTASKLKSHLVSNATLSHISGLYNLPSRLKGDPYHLPVLRAQTDVRAAIVEAYIAAVYFSFPVDKRFTDAMPVLDEWLREMYEPLYDFFYTYMKAEHDQHRNAVGENPDGTVQTISDTEMTRIDEASTGMAALLRAHGNAKERKITYDDDRYDTSLGILWHTKVSVDGIELGEATRADKKLAKNVAAWEAAKKLGLAPN